MIKFILKLLFYIPAKLFFPIKVLGKENLKHIDRGAVFACNHYSNIDGILITINLFKTDFKYLAKIELAKNRLSRWFFKMLGAIYIDRGKADITAMRRVMKCLKNNENIMIFPEGTRNKSDDDGLQTMKDGVVYLASKTDSYVVPMLIEKRPKVFSKNRIIIGKPYLIDKDKKSQTEHNTEELGNKINELRLSLQK